MAERRKEARNNRAQPESSTMIVVRVVPRSSKIAITQQSAGIYKIRLTAPPVDGAANAQLLDILAEKLSLSRSNIHLISGETGRTKRFRIVGLDPLFVSERLLKP